MTTIDDELAAQYTLARSDRPSADIESIVALIAERMGLDGEAELAAESIAWGGDLDVIRQFVFEMEEEDPES